MQGITMMERVVNTAAQKLGIDQVEITDQRPRGQGAAGPVRSQRPARHALDQAFPEAALARGV